MKRRFLSVICALCLGLLPPITASAAGGEMNGYTHYLALGDRTCAAHEAKGSIINYKYQPTPYPAWIAEAKKYILTTSAKDGETSASLLERLPEERAQIEKSAVISVTIGNTDLLYALRDYLTETYNESHPNGTLTADEVLHKMGRPDTSFLDAMNSEAVGSGFVESAFYQEAAAALKENLGKILTTIKSYNSHAYLMVFNLYNPYRNMMEGGSNPDKHVKPYSAGVPTAYDKGAQAMNAIIEEVCGRVARQHLEFHHPFHTGPGKASRPRPHVCFTVLLQQTGSHFVRRRGDSKIMALGQRGKPISHRGLFT